MEKNAAGVVASIEKVGDELQAGADSMADWVKERGNGFFLPPDNQIVPALTTVSTWASTQGFKPAAMATFLQVADYWLVAHALAHQLIVVTHEVPAETVNKIKIPNACLGLHIQCMNPYEMLRRERARFVLSPQVAA
jgi:hypothetical protein